MPKSWLKTFPQSQERALNDEIRDAGEAQGATAIQRKGGQGICHIAIQEWLLPKIQRITQAAHKNHHSAIQESPHGVCMECREAGDAVSDAEIQEGQAQKPKDSRMRLLAIGQ